MKRLWLTGLLLGAALSVAGIAIEWPAGQPVAVAASPSTKAPQRIVSLNLCADQYLLALADRDQIAGLTALDEKAVDAATILEPIWTKVKAKYKAVFRPGEMLPSITQTVGVVRSDFLADHGDLIRGIVAARQKGVEYIYANPEEAGQILAKAYSLDPAIAVEAVKNVAAIKYWSPGSMDRESMTNMVKAMQLVGATPEGAFDWSGLIDESYLPESLRSK